jgi:hypothetical protein
MNDSKMRDKIQQLYDKVSGRDVFVIGGGPSFKTVDKSSLKGKNIICLNTAYREFPDATALYWCDESWIGTHYDNVMNHPCQLRFTARHTADGYIKGNLLASGNATVLRRTGDYGIDMNIDNVRGNNSGAHMLNFLANIKVKRIILLGYDMKVARGQSHWHEGHGLPMGNYIYDDLFVPSINSMAPGLKNMKIDVVNCSPSSALECFRKDKLENYL